MDQNLEEMCRLVTGKGAWHIGELQVSDGPHGVRAQEDGAKNNDSYEATCFPTASSVACSWDPVLIGQMAEGIAKEAKELGVSVVLGPGINIKRSPLCGRNFEYYSEDPFLAGELAVAYIRSMQKCGVGTSLKHFAGNNQETHRMTSNSMIDERALHEIYLAAFEQAVKRARPATVMAGYNYLNGVPACENRELLTGILRDRWGYEGLVMSDWGACVDLPACIRAGMDVEMPDSNGNHFKDLSNAIKTGKLPVSKLAEAAQRIKELEETYGRGQRIGKRLNCVVPETRCRNHELAEKIEEESAVLLQNDGFLPLKGKKEILILGDLALHPRIQGGGSSHIHTERVDSVMEALEKEHVTVHFARGYQSTSWKRNKRLEKEALFLAKEAKERKIPVLFFGGLTDIAEGEGYDRESFSLPQNQSVLLQELLKVNDNIGFISISGSPYDMQLVCQCRAVLQLYLGGEAAGTACARLVTGKANPCGKLAETIPYREEDVPSYGNFGKQKEQRLHPDEVEYRESIFVGYRYYDTFQVPVRFCFGHGLSYTSFSYSNLTITENADQSYTVTFEVENTGETAGMEISQVYVRNSQTEDFRAKRELRGFAKTALQPGEKKKVEVMLTDRTFSVYQNSEFQVIGGTYEIQIGASLNDIRLTKEMEISGVELKGPLSLKNPVPLTKEDFDRIYTYPRTHLSHTVPGEFTTKNSLTQMQPYSRLARRWIRIGKLAARLMYFPKSVKDPEVRMMLEGILEGNLDSVCNQSGGMVKRKTILKIVDSANRGKKHE